MTATKQLFLARGAFFLFLIGFFFIINILNLVHTACFRNMRVSRIKLTGTVVLFLSISKSTSALSKSFSTTEKCSKARLSGSHSHELQQIPLNSGWCHWYLHKQEYI